MWIYIYAVVVLSVTAWACWRYVKAERAAQPRLGHHFNGGWHGRSTCQYVYTYDPDPFLETVCGLSPEEH